jgi:hypothetical protein
MREWHTYSSDYPQIEIINTATYPIQEIFWRIIKFILPKKIQRKMARI